jgi:uncharacterized protein
VSSYLHNRVLKFNVGYLLNDGPAHSQDSQLDIPAVRVSDDLILAYIRGPIRLSRTKEGILVQAHLHIGIPDECFRCLDDIERDVEIELEELFTYHSLAESDFRIGEDAILDMNPLIREEVLIAASHPVTCSEDCKGLCPECGVNLNRETCDCERESLDPRFAMLKQLLGRDS